MEQKIALVTGGSRGVGRATCFNLARDGHIVIVNYQAAAQAAAQVVDEIKANGGEAFAIQADVSKEDEVAAMFKTVVEKYDDVSVLVNNAGILKDSLLLRMKTADFENVWRVNMLGTFLCTRAVLRGMNKKQWGRIVNVSSVSGFFGNAGQSNYAAAKAGIVGFTKSVAREVGKRNITVNAILPGLVDTDAIVGVPQAAIDYMLSLTTLDRIARPQEIADVISFLTSEKASYITGAALGVDGGMGA